MTSFISKGLNPLSQGEIHKGSMGRRATLRGVYYEFTVGR